MKTKIEMASVSADWDEEAYVIRINSNFHLKIYQKID